VGEDGARHVPDRIQVDGEDVPPEPVALVELPAGGRAAERRPAGPSRIVDEDIDPAPRRMHRSHEIARRRRIAEIGRCSMRRAAAGRDLRRDARHGLELPPADRDAGAGARQAERSRPADAAAAAGHDGRAAGELAGPHSAGRRCAVHGARV